MQDIRKHGYLTEDDDGTVADVVTAFARDPSGFTAPQGLSFHSKGVYEVVSLAKAVAVIQWISPDDGAMLTSDTRR